jgi:hypothetical protein
MRVNRVGVLSAGKLSGLLSALMGLIFGAIFALISMVGGVGAAADSDATGAAGLLFGFGVAAIIVLPILYGLFGFLYGMLGGLLYNLVAGIAGGLEVDITQ